MILGIDLSDGFLSLSLRQNQQEIILFKKRLNHMELSPYLLQRILEAEQINLSEIQRLALISGPGNYTGLRASTLLMRSLSIQLHRPIWHLTRLEALIFACRNYPKPVWTSQFVRMNQYYFAKGQYHAESGFCFAIQPQTGTADDVYTAWTKSPEVLFGDWTEKQALLHCPSATHVSALTSWCEESPTAGAHWSEVHPFYIRPAVNSTPI